MQSQRFSYAANSLIVNIPSSFLDTFSLTGYRITPGIEDEKKKNNFHVLKFSVISLFVNSPGTVSGR